MAPLPIYQAKAPSFDKVIFAAPECKRKREGNGPRTNITIVALALPPPSNSPVNIHQQSRLLLLTESCIQLCILLVVQDNSSHSQEQEANGEEVSHGQTHASSKETSGHVDEGHSAEPDLPKVYFFLHLLLLEIIQLDLLCLSDF